MKSSIKTFAVGIATGGLLLAGAGAAAATTPTEAPAGSPVDCVTPALEDPAGTLTKTLEDPAGSLEKDVACLSGQG